MDWRMRPVREFSMQLWIHRHISYLFVSLIFRTGNLQGAISRRIMTTSGTILKVFIFMQHIVKFTGQGET